MIFENFESEQALKTKLIVVNLNDSLSINISLNGDFYCSKIINNTPIRISEYPYDNYWELLSSETGWRNQNMHELIVKRVKHENISTKKIIQNLPKENSSISRSSTKLYIKLFVRKILDCFMFFIPKKILFKLFKMYS